MQASLGQHIGAEQRQIQKLAPQMRQSLDMLAMNLADLRQTLYREMQTNPVIEDIGSPLEPVSLSRLERESDGNRDAGDSDWPDEDWEPKAPADSDADAAERRQRFFDMQTSEETLEEHLKAQLGNSGLPKEDLPLANALVGELDSRGWFAGSIPDISMATGADEAKIKATLALIMTLDPPGCGATSLEECLLAQTDALGTGPRAALATRILRLGLLETVAAGGAAADAALAKLGVTREDAAAAIAAIASLEPRPARAFAVHGKEIRYIRPEVKAVLENGRWIAVVDDAGLPEIHVSKKYLKILEDPSTDAETREYVRAKISSANFLADAVSRRVDTLKKTAQAIFDAQPGFFERGLSGLKPLTMEQIAVATGVNHSTVSRAVSGKYAATPKGTYELRRFFVAGCTTPDGKQVSRIEVTDALRSLVEGEDAAMPLSDEKLGALLKERGYTVARRTVAKYRSMLGIPGAAERAAAKKEASK